MKSNLHFLHYNNYYNRIVKKEDTLDGYIPYRIGDALSNINFNPGNGISAVQVINWPYNEDPDYMVEENLDGSLTRWFVMSSSRTKINQYQVELLRDVIADYREEVLASTAYIERSSFLPLLNDGVNPLIYNSEGIQFNQIKMKEDLLYDKTNSAWIVGYVAPNATKLKDVNVDTSGSGLPLTNYSDILQLANQPQYVLGYANIRLGVYKDSTSQGLGSPNLDNVWHYWIQPQTTGAYVRYDDLTSEAYTQGRWKIADRNSDIHDRILADLNRVFSGTQDIYWEKIVSYFGNGLSTTNTYMQYNGKVVKDTANNKYYKITVKNEGYLTRPITGNRTIDSKYGILLRNLDESYESPLYTYLNDKLAECPSIATTSIKRYPLWMSYNAYKYTLSLTEITYGDVSISFGETHRSLEDAPYSMFAMKYSPKNYALACSMNLENGDFIWDIQVLPYCPVQEYYNGSTPILTPLTLHKDFEIIHYSDQSDDYLFWCPLSNFTFNIDYTIPVNDRKMESNTDFYRLCSPNGNGQFEFNAAKNNGVGLINIDCTYRPYDPYIHLNPDFNGLYGKDYNDFRGLVLNGDFSIPALNDRWVDYTINNKNYQNIFNREIQSLDMQHNIQNKEDIYKAIVGTLTGGVSGALSGSLFGGVGTGIGGTIGGIASGIAGGFDVHYNRQLRAEQRSLKEDLWKMNLQNIQALPYSISKTGCITYNNKLVPYIEYYTCTDEEKEFFQKKIQSEGMNIGVVGTISEYTTIGSGEGNPQYIQANIIKMPISTNYEIAIEIANTMKGGVRFV